MEKLARLGLRTDPTIFFTSAGLMVLFLVALIIAPEMIGSIFAAGRSWVVTNLGWFFIFGVSFWLVFLLWIALSRYGNIRLGGEDDRPEYGVLTF
ncbi:BCCT family transporter [Vreelandella alkaliphila]|uniref:BCCT family transporter n=1 Tax=Vreelandella alkaliphila TaxID=272774 RepID=A0AAJ2S0Y4_9GAMM|nr:BCCT family transporter [Halomonas alkaliphila]MDX5977798.1 BCCT family transporter [Halomonas alkaliphila]